MAELAQARHGAPHSWWKTGWRALLAVAVIALVGFLLYRALSGYSMAEIMQAIRTIPTGRIALAGLFAAASYASLTLFDWLALRYAGHPLAYRRAALASFTSLSIGHTLGLAALSSGAIRYRFYARWGLKVAEVAKVVVFCGITVGLGLVTLGGLAVLIESDLAAKSLGFGNGATIAFGLACLAVPAGWIVLSFAVRRPLHIRRWTLEMPPPALAMAQIVIGTLNYVFVSACLYQVLAAAADVTYLRVATVYVIANAGALASHVPGGLGVIESVVQFLIPGTKLIGALVMFRVVYFLVPLCLGLPSLLLSEWLLRNAKVRKSAKR